MILIGIDFGTTMLKAAAFDAQTGTLRARSLQRLPVEADDTGRREIPMPTIDAALTALFDELRAQLREEWCAVGGLGVAAQGGSMIIVVRDTGCAMTPMILWNDSRAIPYLDQVTAGTQPREWRAFSLRDEPGMGLARLLWLRDQHPELLDERYLYAGAGDYVYFRLTGVWRQDACHALQTGCYDARRQCLISAPFAKLGVPLDFVPPLRIAHETTPLSDEARCLFDLPMAIAVAGPYNDHEAAFCAIAHLTSAPLQCSLGTAWVGNFLLPDSIRGGSPFQLVIPAPVNTGSLVIQPLLTGNVSWNWAVETLLPADRPRAMREQDAIFTERVLPPYGVVALPWVNRPHPLAAGVMGAGCVLGIGPQTTATDIMRALAAGMCCEFYRVFRQLSEQGVIDAVILSGGASKARHFRELIAALFAPLPVLQVEDEDSLGARGSLHAFACHASRATARLTTHELDIAELHRHYALYGRAYESLYGECVAGQPFTLGP